MDNVITVEDARPLIAQQLSRSEEDIIQVSDMMPTIYTENGSVHWSPAFLCERCSSMDRVELGVRSSVAKRVTDGGTTIVRDYIYGWCNHCGTGYWCWYGPEHDFRDVFSPQPIGGQV